MSAAQQLAGAIGASPNNLLELLIARVRERKGAAAEYKTSAGWQQMSWVEVLNQVRALSAGLVAWGVKPGDRVALFGATSLQWVLVDLAISAARAVSVPIYASNTPDEIRYVLQHSGAVMLLVDHDRSDGKQPGRLSRALSRVDACPDLKRVVVFEADGRGGCSTLEALIEAGSTEPSFAFDERVSALGPDDLCHLIYTSGTTGEPKGVMLTQGNWVYQAEAIAQVGLMRSAGAVMLFLPMAHSFGQTVKAAWLGLGFRMVFAEALETLVANLSETHPTVLPAVPRVYEKVFAAVKANATTAPGLKGALGRWAFRCFDAYADARAAGQSHESLQWSLAKKLVFSKIEVAVKQKLGGQMEILISGSAPLSPKLMTFFELLGLEVLEGYGLTETSAAATVNRPAAARLGTVGPALPGSELKIAADGEILIRGPGVMRGYYCNQAATDEVLEKDGWFHSGDIGAVDSDGYLAITDRKKDIIVTAGGKNVAPQNIENALKTHPLISSVMVHGDRRPYLTALICVNEEQARTVAGSSLPYAQLAAHPQVRAAVQQIVDGFNAGQPPYASLKRFSLVDHEFSQESGELTPTLKVKRKHCSALYAATLDAMYSG